MKSVISFFKTKMGIAAIGVLIVGLGAWYALSGGGPEYKTLTVKSDNFVQQVSVSGKVIPAQEVDLGFTQSGRITRVYVKVGDRVGAGRVLAEIDSGDIYAQLLQKEAALDVQKAKLLALQQGTRPEEIAVAEADVRSDEAVLAQAKIALVDATGDAYIKTDDAIRNKVYQFVSNPRTNPQINLISSDSQAVVDANNGLVSMEATLVAWSQELGSVSASSDLATYVTRVQQRLSTATQVLTTVSKVLNSASPTNVSQTTLDTYATNVATARANVSTVSSAITSAVTALRNAESGLNASKKTLALKQAGTVQADIDAQAAQVKSAEADVANARSQLSKTVITAPFTGVITSVDAKAGKIVSPNTPEISMNSSAAFQIESYIPEVNIAFVKVGDVATVTLDAYGEEVPFGAKVVSIDPAETIKDGVPTYRALLQFDGNDSRIRAGMTANLQITTEEKSGVVSVPQGVVTQKNGKKYVKILEDDSVIEREVTTGSVSSLGNVEILTGLGEGDVVILGETE
jgi:HlyD family secretion protein